MKLGRLSLLTLKHKRKSLYFKRLFNVFAGSNFCPKWSWVNTLAAFTSSHIKPCTVVSICKVYTRQLSMSLRTNLKVPKHSLFYFAPDQTVSVLLKRIEKVISGDNISKGSKVMLKYGKEVLPLKLSASLVCKIACISDFSCFDFIPPGSRPSMQASDPVNKTRTNGPTF